MIPVERQFSLPHIQLSGLSWGEPTSEPVLALHGWLDNAASFYRLAPLLQPRYVLAPDLAGHGRSAHRPSGTPYYIWDHLIDLLALLDALELSRVHLVGHSMGAGIAALLAAVAPERVGSVVLLDGLAPLTTPAEQSPAQMAQALRQRSRLPGRLQRVYAHRDEAVMARANSRFPVPLDAAQQLAARALSETETGWQWHTDPCLVLPSVLRLTEAQVSEFLKVIRAPVCLCLAERGIATAQTHQLAQCVEGIQVECLPGGHHFHLEQASVAAVAASVNRHLSADGSVGV